MKLLNIRAVEKMRKEFTKFLLVCYPEKILITDKVDLSFCSFSGRTTHVANQPTIYKRAEYRLKAVLSVDTDSKKAPDDHNCKVTMS